MNMHCHSIDGLSRRGRPSRPLLQSFSLVALLIVLTIGVVSLSGCFGSSSDELKGVGVTDSGTVYVTFRLPDGKTLSDVLGQSVSEDNVTIINDLNGGQSSVHWSHVGDGLVVWNGSYCCYSPTAGTVTLGSTTTPPAYMLMSGSIECLDSADVGELAERYGITLNL